MNTPMPSNQDGQTMCPNDGRVFQTARALATHLWWESLTPERRHAPNPRTTGALNGQWLDTPGRTAIHEWVRNRLPKPDLCPDCKTSPPRDLANISQEYKRDLADWEWLCRRCHMTKDGRLNKLIADNKGKRVPACSTCGRWLSKKGCLSCQTK